MKKESNPSIYRINREKDTIVCKQSHQQDHLFHNRNVLQIAFGNIVNDFKEGGVGEDTEVVFYWLTR